MNQYPAPFNYSDEELRFNIIELVNYRIRINLERKVINYEGIPKHFKAQDDKEMEYLSFIICEYLEEYVYRRGNSI